VTVHFIGAGPGAADLITLRGRDLLAACPVCLYAGSLVPQALLAHCPPGARLVNTAPMSLDDIVAEMRAAHARGEDVARLHSGDLSIWSAMGEQIRALREHGVPYTVTPGVPSFSAAAAALGAELTLPGACQSVVLTRTSGRASQMPSGENLAAFAATGAVLAIHLSVHVAEQVQAELLPHYGADCPAAIVWRASWGDETIVRTRVGEIAQAAQANPLQRSALILVGATLAQEGFGFSRLYADDYDRRWRPRGDEPRFPVPDADEPAHGDGEPRASTPDEVPATSQAREGGRADA
jgi:precorrin-4/cobalt-precorrin-4 C11-methyltransferase